MDTSATNTHGRGPSGPWTDGGSQADVLSTRADPLALMSSRVPLAAVAATSSKSTHPSSLASMKAQPVAAWGSDAGAGIPNAVAALTNGPPVSPGFTHNCNAPGATTTTSSAKSPFTSPTHNPSAWAGSAVNPSGDDASVKTAPATTVVFSHGDELADTPAPCTSAKATRRPVHGHKRPSAPVSASTAGVTYDTLYRPEEAAAASVTARPFTEEAGWRVRNGVGGSVTTKNCAVKPTAGTAPVDGFHGAGGSADTDTSREAPVAA